MALKEKTENVSLFQWSDSIAWHKVDLMNSTNEHQYDIFMTNRHLGMGNEFIGMADFANSLNFTDKYMHYQFMLNVIQKPKRKPFIPFVKSDKVTDEVKMISEYFEVNNIVAASYLKRLTEEDLEEIKLRLNPDKGGKEKLNRRKKKS